MTLFHTWTSYPRSTLSFCRYTTRVELREAHPSIITQGRRQALQVIRQPYQRQRLIRFNAKENVSIVVRHSQPILLLDLGKIQFNRSHTREGLNNPISEGARWVAV